MEQRLMMNENEEQVNGAAPIRNMFDELSLLAITFCLTSGVTALHDASDPVSSLVYKISVGHQISMGLILISKVLAHKLPKIAYILDRTGVSIVFGSLFYVLAPGLYSLIIAVIPTSIYAAKKFYDKARAT